MRREEEYAVPEHVDTEAVTRKQIGQSQRGFEKKNERGHYAPQILVSPASAKKYGQ